jgi:Tfp pilus assembly protein PilV
MRARLRDERGFALPVVLAIMVVALLLLVAMMSQNISATDTARRDVYQRQALQAAEAGLDLAEYRAYAVSLDARSLLTLQNNPLLTQCVVQVSGTLSVVQLPTIGQWCDASASEGMGNGASYTYRISPPATVSFSSTPGATRTCRSVLTPVLGALLANTTCLLLGDLYTVTELDKVLRREVVSTGMAGPGCPNGSGCVKRRLYATYRFGADSSIPIPANAGLLSLLGQLVTPITNLLTNGGDLRFNIQLYGRDSSFKECSATPPTPANPASGC